MQPLRSRVVTGAAILLFSTTFAACSDSGLTPVSPETPSFDKKVKVEVTPVPLVMTSTVWDFADILPGSSVPVDLGTSETIALTGNGFIEATAGDGGEHITVKGKLLPVTDPERGLGLCLTGEATCTFPADGDEVGDGGPGTLLLDFDGVEPEGSTLAAIEFGSVQVDEGYRYSISTDGGTNFGAPVDWYNNGSYPNNDPSSAIFSLVFDPQLPTADLVIMLEKSPDLPGTNNDNDYTVRSVTIEYTSNPQLEGRMTGGGVKATGDEGEVVTLGLTLHCDILLSNNLEVNWQGHQWHLAKPITSAQCTNEPEIDPPPPAAPIDTFEGTAFGRLDGVGDSFVWFRFQDAGEPGREDTIELTIYEPGSMVEVALNVTLQYLSVGNFQMHYDQPHGQKP